LRDKGFVVIIKRSQYFPSFSEGLSLRVSAKNEGERYGKISLPFRRDFH